MPFNITNFKSTIDYYGGPARSSLFEVRIAQDTLPREPRPATTEGGLPTVTAEGAKKGFGYAELPFFCKSASIPGITFNTATFEAVSQLPKQFPVSMASTPFSAIFMVDSDHEVLKYFHRWMQYVLNYNNENPFAEVDMDQAGGYGQLPFEVGYKSEYAKRLEVRHYSTESDEEKYYTVTLERAFPVAIGDIELAWENNDSFLTLPITFAYDKILYSGQKTGAPSSRFSRGRNLLDTLGAIAGFAGVVQQTFKSGKPTSIQDAINRLTRVNSSFDNISRRRR